MSIHFQCPHCKYVTTVPEAFAGHHQPCAQCGEEVQIPVKAHRGSGRRRSWLNWVIVLVAICVLATCLFPIDWNSADRRQRQACYYNLREIGLALITYGLENDGFPPAYTKDENGRRLHSWRSLILPYMDQKKLFEQINFDVPWDAPENKAAREAAMEIFQCPSSDTEEASYMVVVGENCMFTPDGKPVSPDDIPDGLTNTITVVEVKNSGVHWMEPVDLNFDEMPMVINAKQGGGISSEHTGGAFVAFVDGHVDFIQRGLTTWTMRNLLKRNDGNTIDLDELNGDN